VDTIHLCPKFNHGIVRCPRLDGGGPTLTEYLTPPRQEVARWRDRLQGHLWRRRRRPERLYIRAKSNYGNIEGKQISKQVGDRRSMFKKNKDSPPPAPLKNRRSDDALALAGRKNSAWPPHDLRRTGATMSRRRASRLI
jgi:hypothetical protein